MICVGNPVITLERRALLETGTILAFLNTDKVVRFWLGDAPGLDFLAGEALAPDGTRWLFGRLRYHVDDNVMPGTSGDRKEVSQIAAGPEVPAAQWQEVVDLYLSVAEREVDRHQEVEVNGSPMQFMEKLQGMGRAFGWKFGTRIEEAP